MVTVYMYFKLEFTRYRVRNKTENLASKKLLIARNGARTHDPQMSLTGLSLKV